MAISANALNLAQYAMMSNDPLVKAITFSLIDNGSVMARDVPFINRATLIANGVRWTGNLPSVEWVPLNTEGTTITGAPQPWQEQAYLIRNYIDADKYLVQDENQIQDPRQVQLQAYLKSVAYDFNHKFINNTPNADVDAIRGLRFRLDNPALFGMTLGGQPAGTVSATNATNKINAAGTTADMRAANMTAATFGVFCEDLEAALWAVNSPNGDGCVIYTNDILYRRMSTASRRFSGQGGFATAQDQLGRSVDLYKNAQIRDVGYRQDQITRIITATEDSAGADGASTFTSLYVVNYGMDSLFGWQFAPLQARDQGLMENNAIYRIGIDWMGGLYQAGHRAIARIFDIIVA